ncbi:MAG: hypothetical protein Kow00114_35580 [Kiloniellaceae bacterium]
MSTAPAAFPLRDAWTPLVPLLPLLAATLLLAPLIDPAAELTFLDVVAGDFIAQPARNYVHLGDLLSYGALAAVHTLLCLGIVAAFALWILRLAAPQRHAALAFLAAVLTLILAFGLIVAAQSDHVVLVQLGYKAACQLLAAAELPTPLIAPGQCFLAGHISPLTWLAWVPTFAGIATVAFAAAFAYGAARDLPAAPGGEDWRQALEARVKALQRSVYLLSAVLVSSTVTITVFAHLPVGLLAEGKPPALAGAVATYATGLSTFWGALFSATLAATFAVPALRLLGQAYGAARADAPGGDGGSALRAWLHDHVFQSLKRQLATALSLLAPLLVGPLSSLLAGVSGL